MRYNLHRVTITLLMAFGVTILLNSCGGANDTSSSTVTLTGIVSAGDIENGEIKACAYYEDSGELRAELGSARIVGGSFTMDVHKAEPSDVVVLEVQKGAEYTDETGRDQVLATALKTVLAADELNEGDQAKLGQMAVTPITSAIFESFNTSWMAGAKVDEARNNAVAAVAANFGFVDKDIRFIPPPLASAPTVDTASDYAKMRTALGTIAYAALQAGVSHEAYWPAMAMDFRDGAPDGKNDRGEAITYVGSATVMPTTYFNHFDNYATAFVSEYGDNYKLDANAVINPDPANQWRPPAPCVDCKLYVPTDMDNMYYPDATKNPQMYARVGALYDPSKNPSYAPVYGDNGTAWESAKTSMPYYDGSKYDGYQYEPGVGYINPGTGAPPPPPPVNTYLSVTGSKGGTSGNISIIAVSGATQYRITLRTHVNGSEQVVNGFPVVTPNTSYTFSNLSTDTMSMYYVEVVALNSSSAELARGGTPLY